MADRAAEPDHVGDRAAEPDHVGDRAAEPDHVGDRAAELDQMTDHEAIISLEREFPGWMIWREGLGRWLNSCFARCHVTDAGVSGEDWADLRDQIVRAEAATF
jgi:hypothetical protein